MKSPAVVKVAIPGFEWLSGKVRDRAVVDSSLGFMVFVTTDRISAFDVVLPTVIPRKGIILNQISNFWKRYLSDIIPNDIISDAVSQYLPYLGLTEQSKWAKRLQGRTVLARMAKVIPVECVVRGYNIPGFLQLPKPLFPPSTKALSGHDENLTYEQMINHLKLWTLDQPEIERWTNPVLLAQTLKSTSLLLYSRACDYARERGVIIADTKFEFGFIDSGLTLIDEVLTPDSSRFWDAAAYVPGRPQKFFDKQPVRDWLMAAGWNKQPPAPRLPRSVMRSTAKRYHEIEKRFISE